MLVAKDERGEAFSEKVILANAMTMLVAGEDTTAYTLAWAVHYLLESPGDVRTLRAELEAALREAPVPLSIELASGLPFAGAIANETMRLRPVAPTFFLEPTKDTVVGGVEVPVGTFLVLLLRAPAVNAAHFGEPQAFRPARWLDPAATGGAHDPGAHQPFGSGPRICPGRSLALLEMKLVLATLYQSFDVERVGPAADVKEIFSFTMAPKGLRVRLRRRGDEAKAAF
jgi:cytochrome P450